MPFFRVPGFQIQGIRVVVPDSIELNSQIDWLEPSQKNKLLKSIGVEERRVRKQGQRISDLNLVAAESILSDLDINKSDIGVIVLITQTGDHQIPSTASAIHAHLGLDQNTLFFELNIGCSGYVYGLWAISNFMNSLPRNKLGLLLVGDVSTVCLNPTDSGTVPLFSDAGSCTVVKRIDSDNSWHFNLQNDGVNRDAIKMFGDNEFEVIGNSFLKLDGISIYNFSLTKVVPSVKALLQETNLDIDDIDYFVFHQASKIINEAIRRKLAIPENKFPYSLREYGNTSSATIPVTLCSELESQLSTDQNKKMLLCGFGTGLSWGSVVLDLSSVDLKKPIIC